MRHPWQLPPPRGGEATGGGRSRAPETLFVDLTFDFLLFPADAEMAETRGCHVLSAKDVGGGQDKSVEEELGRGSADSVAVVVAVRVGALVAAASSQRADDGSVCEEKARREAGGDADDEYQCRYLRGDQVLTFSGLEEHCRCIDIVMEEMEPADVAALVGDALLEGCGPGEMNPWQVVTRPGNGSAVLTIEDGLVAGKTQKHSAWSVKVHHKALTADGFLPLSTDGVRERSIERDTIDAMLLQSNDRRDGGICVPVPPSESFRLWRRIDPDLVQRMEERAALAGTSTRRMRGAEIAAENRACEVGSEEEETIEAKKGSEPTARRDRPTGATSFARREKTTLGGHRRKKQKFTFGPA